MLDALTKKEEGLLKEEKPLKVKKSKSGDKASDMLDADGNPLQWDHGLRNIEKEKASSLAILGKLVPQAEIFLKTTQKSH